MPESGSADLEGESGSRTKLISISMDVCGSTEAKACMKACARDDEELAKWYEEFHREFLWREWRFYSLLFRDGYSGLDWDWKHAFVVKGIGDEIWLLYEVGEDDLWKLGSLVARLLHAALEAAGRPIRWTSAPDDAELPVGRTLETQESAVEVLCRYPRQRIRGQRTAARFRDRARFGKSSDRRIVGKAKTSSNWETDSTQATYLGDGRRLVTAIRTDYIGWEVDRFFRATKFALPRVVVVGKALFEGTFGLPQHPDENVGGTWPDEDRPSLSHSTRRIGAVRALLPVCEEGHRLVWNFS